jgi:hypothetical protein
MNQTLILKLIFLFLQQRTSPLLRNLDDDDDPLSSPLRPMTPKTQELYKLLVEPGVMPCYPEDTDDFINSPNLVIQNSKQAANCDSKTDCETDEEIPKLTQRLPINYTDTRRETVSINLIGEKDDTLKNILTEKEETGKHNEICDIPAENNTLHEIKPSISGELETLTITTNIYIHTTYALSPKG